MPRSNALTTRITERLVTLQLPAFAGEFDGGSSERDKVYAIAAARCGALGAKSQSNPNGLRMAATAPPTSSAHDLRGPWIWNVTQGPKSVGFS